MTVAELILELQKLQPDLPVKIYSSYWMDFRPVEIKEQLDEDGVTKIVNLGD